MVCGRLDQNSGVHGNRKPPLTCNGENGVSAFFSVAFGPILFILAGNEDMRKISDKFEFRPDRTTQNQDQDRFLVKRRNDNHSPGPVIRELVPSSHQRSELSNRILYIFSR